jgi:hypothetical protein
VESDDIPGGDVHEIDIRADETAKLVESTFARRLHLAAQIDFGR